MHTFRLSLRKFFYRLRHDYFSFDNLILLIAVVLCFVWTYGSIAAMTRNWELAQRLSARKKELTLLQLEVDTLELENEYYRSAEYQELAARAKQNKKLPGENLVYLPENSAYAKTKHKQVAVSDDSTPSNFAQWMSFLFGV